LIRELGISNGRRGGGDWERVLAGWTDGLTEREMADVESSGGGLTSCYFDIICWVGGKYEIGKFESGNLRVSITIKNK
jgi:hypothetical protein